MEVISESDFEAIENKDKGIRKYVRSKGISQMRPVGCLCQSNRKTSSPITTYAYLGRNILIQECSACMLSSPSGGYCSPSRMAGDQPLVFRPVQILICAGRLFF
jgi:hypothetical protein